MADDGPSFINVLAAALGGELLAVTVEAPARRAGARDGALFVKDITL